MLGTKIKKLALVGIAGLALSLSSVGMAQNQFVSGPDSNKIRKELVKTTYYGVFDNLEYQVQGNTVILTGQVVKPTTKDEAAGRVKHIAGVSRVVNNIEVLPLSPNDDRIRRAEYRAIFGTGGLQRYGMGTNPSIHIIVDNGHVSLEGVVDTSADRNLANIRANQVPGVFSVTNNLRITRERR
jgi:hyperosmotically inducible protein